MSIQSDAEASPSAPAQASAAGPPRRSGKRWLPAMLAGAVVIGLWGPNLVRPPPAAWTSYISTKGQIRRVRLADKSVIRLNGATAMKVVFDERTRLAQFEGGEAAVNVMPNARPFVVDVGDRRLMTRGGEFNLLRYGRLGGGRTVLTLRRGQAQLGSTDDKTPAVTLDAGQQVAWADGQGAVAPSRVDPDAAFAWERRRLIYQAAPLGQVVSDMNRYVARPIAVSDPRTAALPFSGNLAIEGEDRMLKRLEAALPIQAQALPAEIVLKPRAPCAAPSVCAPAGKAARRPGAPRPTASSPRPVAANRQAPAQMILDPMALSPLAWLSNSAGKRL